jgi:predicted transglutaminase-like cysteine proteinase
LLLVLLSAITLVVTAGLARAASPSRSNGAAISQYTGAFGSLEFRTNATKGLGEWKRVLVQLAKEQQLYEKCDAGSKKCPSYLQDWRKKLKQWSRHDLLSKMSNVNAYVNDHIRYADDRVTFGKADYWASPATALKGAGDCEDYAIAKYVSLRALGVPEDSLRIVIVDDMRRRRGHAVLSVNTTSGLFVLDNLRPQPYLHQQVTHYAPVYSINTIGRWINVATRKMKPEVVASLTRKRDAMALTDILRPSLSSIEERRLLRPSLDIEPATGSDLVLQVK